MTDRQQEELFLKIVTIIILLLMFISLFWH